jgi:hypothetical protein
MRMTLKDYIATPVINSTGLILVHRKADHVKYRALDQGYINWRKQNQNRGTALKTTG